MVEGKSGGFQRDLRWPNQEVKVLLEVNGHLAPRSVN